MSLLVINNLKKSFASPDGAVNTVVDIPEFTLKEGQQMALQGASGSGKTTFLNLIAGILQPNQGTILLGGTNVAALSESGRDRLRALNIGYVFQTFNLLQGYTALENVSMGMLFGKGVDEGKARNLLERVGLADRMDYRPSQLSIGQQQRVAVARALANHPKLVLADEPTGNLDPLSSGEALEIIREICRENDAALLLVSHDESVLDQFEDRMDLTEINRAMKRALEKSSLSDSSVEKDHETGETSSTSSETSKENDGKGKKAPEDKEDTTSSGGSETGEKDPGEAGKTSSEKGEEDGEKDERPSEEKKSSTSPDDSKDGPDDSEDKPSPDDEKKKIDNDEEVSS